MNWYLTALKKYAVFSGRARRSEYWYFALFNFIIFILIMIIAAIIGKISASAGAGIGILSFVYGLAVLIPGIAVSIRRLHDTDRSGWWILLGLVPIAGIVLLYFMVIDGNPAPNRYGPNPKAAATPAA